jgi:hypothetical protein
LRNLLLERAGQLAVHSEDPWKNLVLVALSYKRARNEEAMRAWFERATRLALDPDDVTRTSLAYRDVVKGLLTAGELDDALDLAHRIPVSAYRDQARAEVASSLARSRRFDEALGLAASLVDAKARAIALRGVASYQARYEGVQEALSTASLLEVGRYRDDALLRVALARAALGDVSGSAMVIGQMDSPRSRELAQLRVAEYQARSNRAGSVETLLSLLNDPYLRDEALRRMVEVQASRFNLQEAESTAYRIENNGERAVAMESLVTLQVRNGDIAGALSRAQSINVEDSRVRALQTIAVAEAGLSRVGAARSVAALIADPLQRDVTYRRIAERAALAGQPYEAVNTIYNIASAQERASALAAVARLRARRGSVTPALILIRDAERVVEMIPRQKDQAKALGILAEAYAEARDAATAMSVAASIDDAGLRDRTYQQLSRKFASLAEVDFAEQSAQSIERDLTRERALSDMARTIAGQTRATEALDRVGDFESREQQVRFLLAVATRI